MINMQVTDDGLANYCLNLARMFHKVYAVWNFLAKGVHIFLPSVAAQYSLFWLVPGIDLRESIIHKTFFLIFLNTGSGNIII